MKHKALLAAFIVGVVVAHPSGSLSNTGFQGFDSRTNNSYDVLRFFHWKFRFPDVFEARENSCERLGFTEHIIAGTMISTLQNRLIIGPEPTFEEWYAGCARSLAKLKVAMIDGRHDFGPESGISDADRLAWFREAFGEALVAHFGATPMTRVFETEWAAIPIGFRREFLRHLLQSLAGPDFVQEDLLLIGPDSTLRGHPADEDALVEILSSLNIDLDGEGEPLLQEAFEFYAMVLLTLPELRIH